MDNDNYFHIRGKSSIASWRTGEVFNVGEGYNPYWSRWEQHGVMIGCPHPDCEEVLTPFELASKMAEGLKQPGSRDRHLLLGGLYADPIKAWSLAGEAMQDFETLFHEFTFEAVRAEEYSNLPSRQRCIFLIPRDVADRAVSYWARVLRGANIYEVRFRGTTARVNDSFLPNEGMSVSRMRRLARLYWSGANGDPGRDEVLGVGSVEVIGGWSLEEFGIAAPYECP